MRTILKIIKWIIVAFIGLVIIAIIFPSDKAKTSKQSERADAAEASAPARAKDESQPSFTTSAAELSKAYDDNTVAADQRFKGQRYEVKGKVASIATDFMGNPYLTLRGGVNEFLEPQFSFNKEQSGQLAQLHKGDDVSMVCTGNGDVAKTAMSDECVLR